MPQTNLSAIFRRSARTIAKTALIAIAAAGFFLTSDIAYPQAAFAYPFWAQQTAPATPREATGRIVCANCHLGAKPTEVEVPQSVLPDTVFEAIVKVPYDTSVQQVVGDGSKGGLNVGAVVMLPEGFKIAPADRIPEEMKEKVGDLYFQPYSETQENIILVGPLPGEQYKELVFPVCRRIRKQTSRFTTANTKFMSEATAAAVRFILLATRAIILFIMLR